MHPDAVFNAVEERQDSPKSGDHMCPHCGKEQYQAGKLGGCKECAHLRGKATAGRTVRAASLDATPRVDTSKPEATPKPTPTPRKPYTKDDDTYILAHLDDGAQAVATRLGRTVAAIYDRARVLGAHFRGRKGRPPRPRTPAPMHQPTVTSTESPVITEDDGITKVDPDTTEDAAITPDVVARVERALEEDAPKVIWCRYCKRYVTPDSCRLVRRHRIMGMTYVEYASAEDVKCGRAAWDCTPALRHGWDSCTGRSAGP